MMSKPKDSHAPESLLTPSPFAVFDGEGKIVCTPQEYFDYVKDKKQHVDDEVLSRYYENVMQLLDKYVTTGQVQGAQKLIFHCECIEKERKLVQLGVDTFVYRDDIEEFIEKVESKVVKIIDIANYPREIPDEIVEVIKQVKDIFDKLYVVFTDYTGKEEKKVEKARRKKDPILFGAFIDQETRSINDRFYFLGDWEDEYCDLTLDKLVNETKRMSGKDIAHIVKTPEDLEEIKQQLKAIVVSSAGVIRPMRIENMVEPAPKSFLAKVRTAFKPKSKKR